MTSIPRPSMRRHEAADCFRTSALDPTSAMRSPIIKTASAQGRRGLPVHTRALTIASCSLSSMVTAPGCCGASTSVTKAGRWLDDSRRAIHPSTEWGVAGRRVCAGTADRQDGARERTRSAEGHAGCLGRDHYDTERAVVAPPVVFLAPPPPEMIAPNIWLWVGFIAFVLVMLSLDLGVFNRTPHVVKAREALTWTAVWVGLALAFAGGLAVVVDHQSALTFLTGYVIEESLSVD